MKRIVRKLLSSPVMVIGIVGLLAGLALIAFGLFHFGWQEGSPVMVGMMLIVSAASLLLPRLSDFVPDEPPVPPGPPDGENGLPPAQDAALSVKDAERQNVAATGRENVARA